MKTLLTLVLLIVMLPGCGGGDYTSYTSAKMKQAELEQGEKPILDMSFTDSGGKPMHMVINLPKQRMEIEQQRSNEWAGVVGGIASTVAPWIGVGMLAHEMSGMNSTSSVNTGTISTSRDTVKNDNGGVVSLSNPVTTTTTTSTNLNSGNTTK